MDCIPSIEFMEFYERITTDEPHKRIPLNGSFEITSRCNLRCIQCYIQGTCSEDDLTYQEICDIIDQVAEEGCLSILITGGEPLFRPDFKDIYKYIVSKGIYVIIFTNGTLITPEIADLFVEYPPFQVEISLYGMTAATYEKITGVRGSFERCIRGIELLCERNIRPKLKSVIMTINRHEVQEMTRYAESLQTSFRFDTMINIKRDGSTEPANLRLSPEEIVALDQMDERRMMAFQDFVDKFGKPLKTDLLYVCRAGIHSFHVSSTGILSVCVNSREPEYDLRRGTFHEGFFEAFPPVRAKKRTRYSECQECEFKGACAQCPAWGLTEHGDPEAKVDFVCQVTKLKMAALRNFQESRQLTKQ
jgi:radical SAM protein with 4Fe4S-binding SPASM domain